MNRDTDVRFEGPMVTDLLGEFVTLWNEHRERRNESVDVYAEEFARRVAEERVRGVRGSENYERVLGDAGSRMDGVCRVVVQGPQHDRYRVGKAIEAYVRVAQRYVFMTTPDIAFDLDADPQGRRTHWNDRIFQTLAERARAGVVADVVSDGIDGGWGEFSTQFLVASARAQNRGREFWEEFWEKAGWKPSLKAAKANREALLTLAAIPGIRSWAHFQYVHAKQVYLDQIVSVIGSFNLEYNSARNSQEASVFCQDGALSRQFDPHVALDISNSTPIVSSNGR